MRAGLIARAEEVRLIVEAINKPPRTLGGRLGLLGEMVCVRPVASGDVLTILISPEARA